MGSLIPALLLIVAIGLFVGVTDPQYKDAKVLRAEVASLDEALDKSKELQKTRDDLLAKYNAFPQDDLERLSRMVPDNIDNVRLILEIDNIAARYGLVIKNITVSGLDGGENSKTFGSATTDYGVVTLSFAVSARYPVFLQFLSDLEDSLRIVDITSLGFNAGDREFTDYTVTLNTYWLK